LAKLSPQQVQRTELAGENIQTVLTHAPGNGAAIGGLKVVAESFRGAPHLRRLLE
jgi:phosphoglucomutase